MAFGDLMAQLGLGGNQFAQSSQPQPTYGNIDPNQLAMLQNASPQPTENVPLLNPNHPLTQALIQSLTPQSQASQAGNAPSIDDTNNPDAAIVATGHPKSQPVIPGSQTPTGGPVIPSGNPWRSQFNQTGVETPGIPDHASALFGLLHGGLAQTLNNFQDKVFMAQGHAPPNYTRVLQEQEANALQGFTDHPMEAIQRLAQVDPQGALEAYNKQLEAARVGQAATDTHNSAVNNLQNNVLGSAGRILSNSTPSNYADHYALAQGLAQRNGFTLDNLAVPKPEDVAAGKGIIKNPDGTVAWDPDTQKTLATASNYGTPSYRVENSASSNIAANARMLGAQTNASIAPSTIRFHNALAQAALSNAGVRNQLAQIDADYHQGNLDEAGYGNSLKALIALANNPQLAGQIPTPPSPRVRGAAGQSSSPAPAPQTPSRAPQSSGRFYSPSTKRYYIKDANGNIRPE